MPRFRVWKWPILGNAAASSGEARGELGPAHQRRLGRARADLDRAVRPPDVVEPADRGDVDDQLGAREPHVEDRHQRLAAGHDASVVAVLGERATTASSTVSGAR